MVLNAESKYPSRRTYVLKLRSDATPDALAGGIENLVTGLRQEFGSARELLEAIGRDLEAAADERTTTPRPLEGSDGDRTATQR